MTMTDPISDMLTRIRNANGAILDRISLPASRQKAGIARILKAEGYIQDFELVEGEVRGSIQITLRYGSDRSRTITGVRRISRPGRRVYAKADRLPKVLGGMGTAIISTSSGLMTDREARRRRLGGEVVAYIW